MRKKLKILFFVLLTIAVIFITRNIMLLCHEWTHGFVAWLFKLKKSPFEIYYGNWTLFNVHEDVDYKSLFISGKGHIAALISISALITNAILYVISIILLKKKYVQNNKIFFLVLYWFALSNIGELFSYIPFRTFSSTGNGDVGHFLKGFCLSPWIVFIPGTILILISLWRFISKYTTMLYYYLDLSSATRFIHFLFLHIVLFFWFGEAVYHFYGPNYWAIIPPLLGVISFIVFYPYERRIKASTTNIKTLADSKHKQVGTSDNLTMK